MSKLVDITTLKTVKSYAHSLGVSTTWVYKLAERKEINMIEIDGVKFVEVKKEK